MGGILQLKTVVKKSSTLGLGEENGRLWILKWFENVMWNTNKNVSMWLWVSSVKAGTYLCTLYLQRKCIDGGKRFIEWSYMSTLIPPP